MVEGGIKKSAFTSIEIAVMALCCLHVCVEYCNLRLIYLVRLEGIMSYAIRTVVSNSITYQALLGVPGIQQRFPGDIARPN